MVPSNIFESFCEKSAVELAALSTEDLGKVGTFDGHSLLSTAVHRNNVSAVEKFLGLGLKLEVADREKESRRLPATAPLIIAIRMGHVECLKLLLKHDGSEVNCGYYMKYARKFMRWLPLDFLIQKPHERECAVARLLLQHGATLQRLNRDNLRNLADRPQLMELLLEAGLDVYEQRGEVRRSLLSLILPNRDQPDCENRLAVIRMLIRYGTDLSDPWYLSWACLNNKPTVAQLLLDLCPVSVLRNHDRGVSIVPSLVKCCHPLCALVYTSLEFHEQCMDCLKLLLASNVQLEWDVDENYREYRYAHIPHASPFDQCMDGTKVGSDMLPFLRLLLTYGVRWEAVCPLMHDTEQKVLMSEGYGSVRSLQVLGRDAIRKYLGPGKDVDVKVKCLQVPTILHDVLLLKDALQ